MSHSKHLTNALVGTTTRNAPSALILGRVRGQAALLLVARLRDVAARLAWVARVVDGIAIVVRRVALVFAGVQLGCSS